MPPKTGQVHKLRLTLAKNLRQIRKSVGLSQEQLAERSGLEQSYISNVENGSRNISIDAIGAIADALSTTGHELLDEQTQKSPR